MCVCVCVCTCCVHVCVCMCKCMCMFACIQKKRKSFKLFHVFILLIIGLKLYCITQKLHLSGTSHTHMHTNTHAHKNLSDRPQLASQHAQRRHTKLIVREWEREISQTKGCCHTFVRPDVNGQSNFLSAGSMLIILFKVIVGSREEGFLLPDMTWSMVMHF